MLEKFLQRIKPQYDPNKIQQHDWAAGFRDRFVDQMSLEQRPKLTMEDKERQEEAFRQLGKVLEDVSVTWILDGAPNISILKGEFIGLHKDIDVSFEPNELETLEKELLAKGYGFFHSYRKRGVKYMERVKAADYKKEVSGRKKIIAAIDEQGKIRSDITLPYIETHVIKRNTEGKPIGIYGAVLPDKWLKPVPKEFDDTQINLQHSAKLAYYKLYSTFRAPYHQKDIEKLVETGSLSLEDVDEIEGVINSEIRSVKDEMRGQLFERVRQLRALVEKQNKQ